METAQCPYGYGLDSKFKLPQNTPDYSENSVNTKLLESYNRNYFIRHSYEVIPKHIDPVTNFTDSGSYCQGGN